MSQEDKLIEIRNIVQQLQLLSIQQTDLLARLDILTQKGQQDKKKPAVASKPSAVIEQPLTQRDLAIGDQVRIDNPRRLQPSTGKVIKITQTRVTVKAANGEKIVRAAKNVTLK